METATELRAEVSASCDLYGLGSGTVRLDVWGPDLGQYPGLAPNSNIGPQRTNGSSYISELDTLKQLKKVL